MARGIVMSDGVKIRSVRIDKKVEKCPKCGKPTKRASLGHRWLRDIGTKAPVILEVTFSKHYCSECEYNFQQRMDNLARPGANFTERVRRTALAYMKDGHTAEETKAYMLAKHHVHVPFTTIQDWHDIT